ncbi:MAG: helix-turn-helix domain-containing protein [Mobilitalea sp.]
MIQYKCICQIQKYMKAGDYMTVGEKIRAYRNLRGISQKILGELSEMNEVTIRKYEAGDRNPKSDQLLKIANALGVSINLFMDFDIETVSDVLSLIFKMVEQVDLEFEGKKNTKGTIDPTTLTLRFKHPQINDRLAKWAQAKAALQKTIDARDEFDRSEEYNTEVVNLTERCERIKQSLVDSNFVVKKGAEGIAIRT